MKKYCELCKKDFQNVASHSLANYSKSLGIEAYLKLNVPISFFKGLIAADELIALEQPPELCECGAELEEEKNYCAQCGKAIEKNIIEKDETDSGEPEKLFNEALGLYLSLKKKYSFRPNHILDKDFNNETDIFLQKEETFKLIEYTTKLKVDKNYVISKIKTLHLVEGSLTTEYARNNMPIKPKCALVLLPLNQPDNLEKLEILPLKIFESREKFKIIKSNFKFKITNQMQIEQDELNKLKIVFNDTLYELISSI